MVYACTFTDFADGFHCYKRITWTCAPVLEDYDVEEWFWPVLSDLQQM
jgi:hypothetical protein